MLKRMASLLLALLFLSIGAPGQSGRFAYIARYQYTGTSGKVTLQLPTSATGKKARLIEMFVSCPTAACTVTPTVAEGLATATLGTTYRLRSGTPASASAKFYTASNASGGTALPAIPLPSGYAGTLDVDDFDILAGEAVSFTIASSSQTATLVLKWEESDR